MTTYRAAVKYALNASRNEKIAALREGLQDVAMELVDLGLTLAEVDTALNAAMEAAEDEATAILEQA